MTWSAQQVRQASLAWLWVPDGSERVEIGDVAAVVTPGRSVGLVGPSAPDDVAATWESALALARTRGATTLGWTIADGSDDVADFLVTRGARSTDATDILARELPADLEQPEGTRTLLVDDEATVRDADLVATEVWGGEAADDETLRVRVAEAGTPVADRAGFQVVAYSNDVPIATGGATRADGVARMWGAGTRPSQRHRGGYRATVAGRLRIAAVLGCTLALVNALTDTSAPILRRLGFKKYGTKRTFRVELPA